MAIPLIIQIGIFNNDERKQLKVVFIGSDGFYEIQLKKSTSKSGKTVEKAFIHKYSEKGDNFALTLRTSCENSWFR
jgi:hypothetical protein